LANTDDTIRGIINRRLFNASLAGARIRSIARSALRSRIEMSAAFVAKFRAVVAETGEPSAGIVDARPLNRAIVEDSMPVIRDGGTRERLMLSYANGMRFELPTLSARRRRRNIAALRVCIYIYTYVRRIALARARAPRECRLKSAESACQVRHEKCQ